MKMLLAALMLAGVTAQAQVKEASTFFIGANNPRSFMDGQYIQLNPNGRFSMFSLEGDSINGCNGRYKLADLELVIIPESCGVPLDFDADGSLVLLSAQKVGVLISQKFVLDDVFNSFPLEVVPEGGFSSNMTTTLATMGAVNQVVTMKGTIYGSKGTIPEYLLNFEVEVNSLMARMLAQMGLGQ